MGERLFAGRFGILGRIGAGGMGAVYRAVDHTTGQLVAVKELHGLGSEDQERFARECAFLAALDEPGVVRYIAHGSTAGGSKFLAMEWVDGPTVSDELKRRAFRLRESLDLIGAVARIVGAIHRRGIVHRDIKPSNIVLQAADPRRPKLLDFGVARLEGPEGGELTACGLVVGSAGYLSPEQATGRRDIDCRADVFALGCVLFKCLTGRVPFRGADPISVMLKITLENAPRVRDFVPGIPEEVDALVAQLLARDREQRPADGAEVAALLAALPATHDDEAPPSVSDGVITGTEQRLSILVLARRDEPAEQAVGASEQRARADAASSAVQQALAPLSLELERLSDGTLAVMLPCMAEPLHELARKAARAALAMRHADPSLYIAIATGRGQGGQSVRAGEMVDRASDLLTHSMLHGAPGDIALDHTMETLALSSYQVETSQNVAKLLTERTQSGVRAVCGRPTPCVGRELEMRLLRAAFELTRKESRARSALVVANAGMGKSRLCHELAGDLDRAMIEVWIARADPLRQATPFGALLPLFQDLAGIRPEDDAAVRWAKLEELVDVRAPGGQARRIAEVLAALLGVASPRPPSPTLSAARRDPALFGETARRALHELVCAVLSDRALLIALEDAQWADDTSVSFLDDTLAALADRPMFVLALARPEIAERHPQLLSRRGVQVLQLEPLAAEPAAYIAREILGDHASDVVVERIVHRAGGNPFFLEELSRCALIGAGEALPDSILAVLESRFDGVSEGARRVLRAAAVFGPNFWDGGVRALLPRIDVGPPLAELERADLVVRARRSRFRGNVELAFASELLIEAAYVRSSEGDLRKAHRAAARWLEAAGERDPIVLADHYQRGGDAPSAVGLLAVAAHLALEASDLQQAIKLSERALACGAFGEEQGKLHVTAADARYWLGRTHEALAQAREALARLEPGGAPWCAAAAIAIASAGRASNDDALKTIAAGVFSLPEVEGRVPARLILFAQAAIQLIFAGRLEVADRALAHIPPGIAQKDPATAAWFYRARAWRALAAGDPCGYGMLMKRSAGAFDQVGDVRNACVQRVNVAHAALCVGQIEDAIEAFDSVIDLADGLGLAHVVAIAHQHAGLAKAWLGRFDEAELDERRAVAAFAEQRDGRRCATARALLARVLLERHRSDEAEGVVREGLAFVDDQHPIRGLLLATGAQVLAQAAKLRGEGVPALALRQAHEACALLASHNPVDEGESYIRWTLALLCWQAGDSERAAHAVAAARASLDERAQKITIESMREPFLTRIPEHALTMALWKRLAR